MRLEQFFDIFELFADAPNAVAKMRELVLELAVQGKLVEQKPAEGDGHALLKQLHKKSPPAATEIEAESVDAELPTYPSSWATSKLGEVAEIIRGVSFPGSAKSESRSNDDVACLRTASVQAEIDWNDLIYISPSHVGRPDQWVTPNDIIISMANSYALVGKVAIVRQIPQKATFGAFLAAIRPILIEPYFLLYVLRSPRMQAAFRASSSQTTNIANISLGRMRPLLFPLPPLAEQKRIVAKVEELMALCDRLEAQQQERDTRHAALARASLARFAEALTPANLDFLFHPSYAITPADLRKTILTLAVQGKLVPQCPNDKPAAELLKQSMSMESGSGGRHGAAGISVWPIDDNDMPGELPASWEWCRLGGLNPSFQNGASSRGDRDGIPVVVLRLADIVNRRISLENTRELVIEPNQIVKYSLREGDILITRVNGSADIVGRFVRVESDIDAIYCDHFIRMRIDGDLADPRFIELLGATELVRDQIACLFITTAGQKTVNQGHISSLLIAVPPLAEQFRIVAKVNQLMAMVDRLEVLFTVSRATAEKLMEAVVAELTAQRVEVEA